MVDMVYPLSSDWSDDDKASRQEYNRMRSDFLFLGKRKKLSFDGDGEGVIQAVDLGTFLTRYSFNCRAQLLGATAIRVPFTADRPQTININGFMLQATGNVDSAVYVGAPDTIYILAIRTDGSTTFTIACRTSANEGTDERLIAECAWDGAAFDATTIINYETEGFGLATSHPTIVKKWVSFDTTGTILDSYGISSVARDSAGVYTISFDIDFDDTDYCAVASESDSGAVAGFACVTNVLVGSCKVRSFSLVGAATDKDCSVIFLGELA